MSEFPAINYSAPVNKDGQCQDHIWMRYLVEAALQFQPVFDIKCSSFSNNWYLTKNITLSPCTHSFLKTCETFKAFLAFLKIISHETFPQTHENPVFDILSLSTVVPEFLICLAYLAGNKHIRLVERSTWVWTNNTFGSGLFLVSASLSFLLLSKH